MVDIRELAAQGWTDGCHWVGGGCTQLDTEEEEEQTRSTGHPEHGLRQQHSRHGYELNLRSCGQKSEEYWSLGLVNTDYQSSTDDR